MDKNTTIAFVLIGVILVVWLYINSPEQPPVNQKNQNDTTLVAQDSTAAKEQIAEKIAQAEKEQAAAAAQKEEESKTETVQGEFAPTNEKERVITFENDLALIEFTTKGARIKKYFLKKYNTWYYKEKDPNNFYDTHVQLINYTKEGGDFNLIFVTKDGQLVNTKNLDFKSISPISNLTLTGGDSLNLAFEFKTENGRVIRKIFRLYGDNYQMKVDVELEKMNDVISSYRYDVSWGNGINFVEKNSVDEATYSTAIVYSGEEVIPVEVSSADEPVKKDLNGKIDWISIKNKYFAVIMSPQNPSPDDGALVEGVFKDVPGLGQRKYFSASLKIPFKGTDYQKDTYLLYIGPLEYSTLKSYDLAYENVIDFGSFFGLKFIIRPISEYILLPLFTFLHMFIPNYGFVIIVFSIIIKFALHPLTKQSYKSMKKMQLLQPKIAELKEKYKDDQQKVQKETMKLYQTYGINPAGGCLPMMLQMPILFALFGFFKVAIEIRQQPFILWIDNLSSPDIIATLPFKLPLFGIDQISGLAVLLGVTMFFQQKMSMKDPSQKAMVYAMPVMFTLMFMSFPSGLNLYYFLFNLFSIIQQHLVNKSKDDSELVPVKNPGKKKGGFMSRMMEAAEKQSQAQKQGHKKRK